jgi:hypothetical protein
MKKRRGFDLLPFRSLPTDSPLTLTFSSHQYCEGCAERDGGSGASPPTPQRTLGNAAVSARCEAARLPHVLMAVDVLCYNAYRSGVPSVRTTTTSVPWKANKWYVLLRASFLGLSPLFIDGARVSQKRMMAAMEAEEKRKEEAKRVRGNGRWGPNYC